MASIYTKKFEDISYEDIENIVNNKVPENMVLEYKSVFKKTEAEKLICAFANTYGGTIIYGVRCNNKTNLPTSTVSINELKLDDTIDSISTQNITPPIFCESKYLSNKTGRKQVFIVRVPESDLTPHAIDNKHAYIKLAGQKIPFEWAEIKHLDWLKNRREKYVNWREARKLMVDLRIRDLTVNKPPLKYWLEIRSYPQYPFVPLVRLDDLELKARESLKKVCDKHHIPLNLDNNYRSQGTVGKIGERNSIKYHIEYDVYGFFLIRLLQPITNDDKAEGSGQNIVPNQLGHLSLFGLRLASTFSQDLGINRSVFVEMKIGEIKNKLLTKLNCFTGKITGNNNLKCTVDDLLTYESNFPHGFKDYDIKKAFVDFFTKIFFHFGCSGELNECADVFFHTIEEN